MNRKISNRMLFIAVFAALFTSSWRFAFAVAQTSRNKEGFIATKIKGVVLLRGNIDVSWKPVTEGSFVPMNYLIQVTQGSGVDLFRSEIDPKTKVVARIGGENSGVSIRAPAILRITGNLMRKVELSRYFVDELPKVAANTGADSHKWFLDEAWKRIAAMITSKHSTTSETDLGASFDVQSSGLVGQIALLSPASGSYLTRTEFPTEINVNWSTDSKQKTTGSDSEATIYKIYLWNQGESRGSPSAVTRSGGYRLQIPGPGNYMVQVESNDGTSISKPHRFFVANPSQLNLSQVGVSQSASFAASLNTPKMQQTIISPSPSTDVRFAWSRFSPADQDLVIVIKQGDHEVLRKVVGSRLSTSVPLGPGNYSWYLAWNERRTTPKRGFNKAASGLHTFTLKMETERKNLSETIDSALKSDRSMIVIVDHW